MLEQYMDSMPNHEIPRVSWDEFVGATHVFEDDLHLVGHPETPTISPFDLPLPPDKHGHRQYNLVQIPSSMKEADFIHELNRRPNLKIGCMDKDASTPANAKLPPEMQQQFTRILVAGGGVQLDPERITALKTILTYIARNTMSIKRVIYSGHNHVCGYVKHELKGISLPEKLGTTPTSPEENIAMELLIKKTAERIQLEQLFPGKVTYSLEAIDRNGGVQFDTKWQLSKIPPAVQTFVQSLNS